MSAILGVGHFEFYRKGLYLQMHWCIITKIVMCLSHHALKVLKKGLLITNFNEKIKIKNANRF